MSRAAGEIDGLRSSDSRRDDYTCGKVHLPASCADLRCWRDHGKMFVFQLITVHLSISRARPIQHVEPIT